MSSKPDMSYVSLSVLEEMIMVVLAFSGVWDLVRLGNGLIRNGIAVGEGVDWDSRYYPRRGWH